MASRLTVRVIGDALQFFIISRSAVETFELLPGKGARSSGVFKFDAGTQLKGK